MSIANDEVVVRLSNTFYWEVDADGLYRAVPCR
jgi:hypothetical protein